MQTSSDMEDVHGISNGFRSTSAHRLYRHGQGMFYRVIAMFDAEHRIFVESNVPLFNEMNWNFSKTKQQRPRHSHYYGNFNYFSHITLANGMILKHAPTKFKWPNMTVEWVCLAHKWCHEQHIEQLALVSRSLSPSISLAPFHSTTKHPDLPLHLWIYLPMVICSCNVCT